MNIAAAKKLVKTYRDITAKKIETAMARDGDSWDNTCGGEILTQLTGFGSDCILCRAVDNNCAKCIYVEAMTPKKKKEFVEKYPQGTYDGMVPCTTGRFNKTFYKIENTRSTKKLLAAIKVRANDLETLIIQVTANKRKKK